MRTPNRFSVCSPTAPAAGACALPACCTQVHDSGAVDLVVAATTDVHGRVRGWDYYANRPDSARAASTRAATIVDSLRAAVRGRVVARRRRRPAPGKPARLRRGARRRLDDADTRHRRDERDAVRRGGDRQSRVQLRRALPRAAPCARRRFRFSPRTPIAPTATHAFRAGRSSTRDGVKIGIVGATTPGSMVWDRDNLDGRLVVRDIVPAVRTAVRRGARRRRRRRRRRRALRARRTVELRHRRRPDVPSENVAARVAREVPGIDLVVFGHSHKEMADTVIGSVAAHAAEELGDERRRRASRAGATERTVARHGEAKSARRTRAVTPRTPQVLAATQEGHRAPRVAYANAVDRTTAVAWRADSARVADTPLIDFILEVERRRPARSSRRPPRSRSTPRSAAGPITVARLAALYPYDNTLRAVKHHRRAAARLSRAQRALLPRERRRHRRRRSGDPRLQLRHRRRRRLHDRRLEAGRRAHHDARVRGEAGGADGQLHDGAQQLSADRRRRIRDASERAGRLRSTARDSPTADRRSAAEGHDSARRLLSSQLAHRAGGGGRPTSQSSRNEQSHGSCICERCRCRRSRGSTALDAVRAWNDEAAETSRLIGE